MNVGNGKGDYEPGTEGEFVYVQTRLRRGRLFPLKFRTMKIAAVTMVY